MPDTALPSGPASLREILPKWIPRNFADDNAVGNAEHVFIAGKTNSGKTILAERMLRYYPSVIVADFKGRIRWPGYTRYRSVSSLDDAVSRKETHIIYAPSWEEYRDPKYAEMFYEWVFRQGNRVCYTDEGRMIAERTSIPEFMHAGYIQGRELGLSMWTSSQRPMGLEQAILSESEKFYIFHLSLGQDRGKFEEMVESRVPRLPMDHSFWYVDKGSVSPPRRMRLSGVL